LTAQSKSNTAVSTSSDHPTPSLTGTSLAGKYVVLVHPAWHSCGSHQVFVAQAQTYRALGAKVISLAVSDFPSWTEGSKSDQTYRAMTADLIADQRFYAGMPPSRIATPRFVSAAFGWLRGDAATMLCETVSAAPLPDALLDLPRIDLIHCNHFFLMPAARRLKRNRPCPILLDTHDIQVRQFALRNESRWLLPPKVSFETMLAREIAEMRDADLLIHLNDEEARDWEKLLPDARHALIYPAIRSAPTGPGGSDIIIVASANHPNYLSIKWFLQEVLPLCPQVPLRIIGNVDEMVKTQAPALYALHAGLFAGRVDDLDKAYAEAGLILLPTISGHGLSIKTAEALSCGAPLIATAEAFRGIAIDPQSLRNVVLAPDAAGFAAALDDCARKPPTTGDARRASDTRQLYEQLFTFEAYSKTLGGAASARLFA
jgi:glycosyltransferase involved in cell wall biosynthesis